MDQDNTTSKLKLDDIYFVLFRHKWKVMFFLVLGLTGAAVVVKWSPRLYQSDAKLLVRYIVQTTPVLRPGSDQQVQVVDARGDSLLSTELEILSSADLARVVAEKVGPIRIAEPAPQEDAVSAATAAVVKGLWTKVQGRATVIHLGYVHSDPEVCQQVLHALIEAYLDLHRQIRLRGDTYDLMAKEAEQRRNSLRETETRLQALREETGGLSLDDAKRTVGLEIEKLRQSILEAEANLAAEEAMLLYEAADAAASATNAADPGPVNQAPVSQETVVDRMAYQALVTQLRDLHLREQDYLARFTEENPLVIRVRDQIDAAEQRLAAMLAAHPTLAGAPREEGPPVAASNATDEGSASRAAALKAKLQTLRSQLQTTQAESMRLSGLENEITEVQRTRDIQEESLRYLVTTLEQTRYDSALQAGKSSSIDVVQSPSDPWVNRQPVKKLAAMVFLGLSGCGVGLAFLLELLLDPRVKRSSQLASRLNLPVYATIPVAPSRQRLAAPSGPVASEAEASTSALTVVRPPANGDRSHYEALRDRLIIYFERVNLRRKPKLVGVTACHGKAGVSSIAEGLAATLSETGSGKVLLVDLNLGQGAVQTYHLGRPAVPLPEVLRGAVGEGSGSATDGLMLASVEASSRGYHPIRTREFDALIPKLKASDFDYVVFDMPPLNPTSVSFRLAGFLDKVLVVAEAERTHVEALKSALSLLQESNSKVALVMNKAREYLPRWLRPPQ